jgi:hypothetical protein
VVQFFIDRARRENGRVTLAYSLTREGGVGIITMNNPPANA